MVPKNIVSDFSMYEGLWKGDANNQFDEAYIEFDADGFWQLYSGGDAIDDGYGLDYENISEFQGTWYLDGDLSAQNYIIIDSNGNWSYYQRTSGDPEATRSRLRHILLLHREFLCLLCEFYHV